MSTVADPQSAAPPKTLAELVERLGNIPLERIRMQPPPGTATEDDVVKTKLCELIDGVIVEKAMGYPESRIAFILGILLEEFAVQHRLGFTVGADALTRMKPGLLRIPDLSFVRWEKVGGDEVPTDPIGPVAPDLAVEVVSAGNPRTEIERKKNEYFDAGVELVWIVYPRSQTVTVWTAPHHSTELSQNDDLTGGDVLPGFSVNIGALFQRAMRPQSPGGSETMEQS